MEAFSVLLVESHHLIREGMGLILKKIYPHIRLFEASNGREALDVLKAYPVHLVLLEVTLSDMNGSELPTKMLDINDELKILVVTNFIGPALHEHLFNCGVKGIIYKNAPTSKLQEAIRSVLNDHRYLLDQVPQEETAASKKKKRKGRGPLTKREIEVLEQLKFGKSSREIAAVMNLSENTVNGYRKEMMQKTNTRNVAELVSYGYQNGWLPNLI